MKLSLILISLLATNVMASTTDLAQVGTTVENVNELLIQTVAQKTQSSGLTAPKITTSYLLGQGLTIAVSPIKFTGKNNPVVEAVTDEQSQQENQQAINTKNAVYWKKAKELSHTAHHLREQGKSLRKSIAQAKSQDKASLNQKLDEVRGREKVLARQRKAHAAVQPQSKQANIGQSQEASSTQLAKVSYRKLFYQELVKSVAQTLCRQAKVLSAIDDEEKISVIYQQGGDKQQKSFNVKGWIVDKSLLAQCGKGEINQQHLAKQVTEYQY